MKSLKDVYWHNSKKLTVEQLKKIIQEEVSLLKEQEEGEENRQ